MFQQELEKERRSKQDLENKLSTLQQQLKHLQEAQTTSGGGTTNTEDLNAKIAKQEKALETWKVHFVRE